ncbi:MAG: carbamoyltransferase [Nitrospirae bacterium]|nr:carbamoyltransferase [Nitrospirota bacterium]
MVVLGLQNMHDAAAALVAGGRVVAAAEEERFVRRKHVAALPIQAVRSCLKEAGVPWSDLDGLAVPWKYWEIGRRAQLAIGAMVRSRALCGVKARRSAERAREWLELLFLSRHLQRALGSGGPRPVFLDHHLCHAASTFLLSPFERAAILVVDGASESHTTMLAIGEGAQITPLARIPLPHSLGQFYAAMTAYLGFRPDQDEYIVMGLSAYGEPRYAGWIREHVLPLRHDGAFSLRTDVLDFHMARVGMFTTSLCDGLGPQRMPDEEPTARHRDVAASVQLVLEDTLIHIGSYLRRLTKADDLCLAGGVAFNCLANRRLRDELGFRRVYVQPAAGDAGAALGAALWLATRRGDGDRRPEMRSVYLGPRYSEEACRDALENYGLAFERLQEEALCERVAANLANGHLTFWFQGRMEWGPRALGNRSLLADPRREDMRELINSKVKHRQPFRPFAPSVLEERAGEFFDLPSPSPFMQFTAATRPEAKGLIPAVTHVDGTARVQTVDRDANPKFRRLLEAFDRKTGVPVLLNTSFNVHEPIVCTPDDAIQCFLRTKVEWLVLDNFLIRQPTGRHLS